MPYIRHLYYEEAGAGRPVILIHCPAVSRLLWRPVMARLQTSCRCIAVDIRGHGRSGLGETPWTLCDAAADIAMLVHRLELEPAPVLVGYSSGALICLQAALDNPDRCAALALIGGFAAANTFPLRNKVRLGLLATRAGLSALVGRNVVATNHTGPAHRAAMLAEAVKVRPQALLSYFWETMRADFTPRLGEIRRPTLLLYGADDEAMHPFYRVLREGLHDARSVFVDHCDHRIPTRVPIACADLLAEFAASLEPPAHDPLLLPTFRHPGVEISPWDGVR